MIALRVPSNSERVLIWNAGSVCKRALCVLPWTPPLLIMAAAAESSVSSRYCRELCCILPVASMRAPSGRVQGPHHLMLPPLWCRGPEMTLGLDVSRVNFADAIKLRILRWENILDYLDGPNVITRVLMKEQEIQSQRRRGEGRSRGETGGGLHV